MAKLRLTAAARRDLCDIQDWGLGAFGLKATYDFMSGFERIFGLLRERPMAGQERIEFGPGNRSFSHRPYRILYQIDRNTVLIVRIIHRSRDVRRTSSGSQ